MDTRYIFQKEQDDKFKEQLEDQVDFFKTRVKIDLKASLSAHEEEALSTFVYENVMNIRWYQRKTKREQWKRYAYIFFTFLLLLGIPFGLLCLTFWLKDILKSTELIAGLSTAIATSLLGLHQFYSSLIDQRKFLSQFHQTLTSLKNILFQVDSKWNKLGAMQGNDQLSALFVDEIKEGIKESRKVVADDTQKYFDKLGSPSFDISNALTSNAKVSKQLLRHFQAFDIDKQIQREQMAKDKEIQREEKRKDQILSVKEKVFMAERNHDRITQQIEQEEQMLDDLDDNDTTAISQKEELIDKLEDKLESIEWDLGGLRFQLEYLEKGEEHEDH